MNDLKDYLIQDNFVIGGVENGYVDAFLIKKDFDDDNPEGLERELIIFDDDTGYVNHIPLFYIIRKGEKLIWCDELEFLGLEDIVSSDDIETKILDWVDSIEDEETLEGITKEIYKKLKNYNK